jgi:hypothetical protein
MALRAAASDPGIARSHAHARAAAQSESDHQSHRPAAGDRQHQARLGGEQHCGQDRTGDSARHRRRSHPARTAGGAGLRQFAFRTQELAAALTGRHPDRFRWLLTPLLEKFGWLDTTLAEFDARMGEQMRPHADAIRRLCTSRE